MHVGDCEKVYVRVSLGPSTLWFLQNQHAHSAQPESVECMEESLVSRRLSAVSVCPVAGRCDSNGHDFTIYLRQRDLSLDKLPPLEISCQHTIDSRYTLPVWGILTVVWVRDRASDRSSERARVFAVHSERSDPSTMGTWT